MSDPNTNPGLPRPRRGLRIALVLSLMVNLLVIGVLAGGVMRIRAYDPVPPMQPDIRALWRAMPDDARASLRRMAREQGFPDEHRPRPDREERRARAAEAQARLLAALRAEDFDTAGFVAMLHAERTETQRRLDAAHAAFAAQLGALSPADRRAMADRLEAAQAERGR